MDDKAKPFEPSNGPFITSVHHVYKDDCLFLYILQTMLPPSEELPIMFIYKIRGEHPWDTFFRQVSYLPNPPDTHDAISVQTSAGLLRIIEAVL